MNVTAACLVLLSLVVAFNLSSALIQISWIAIGLFGLGRRYYQNNRVRFSEQEEKFRRIVFPGTAKTLLRRLLDAGDWTTLAPGEVLIQEGEPVQTLFFVSVGDCEAVSRGRAVGHISQGFVGEINVLREGQASATVRAVTECRTFFISGDALRRLSDRDPEMRTVILDGLSKDTHRKLIAVNNHLTTMNGAELRPPQPETESRV